MDDLIIAVGINEHVSKETNPNVPITPEEIARDARACVDAGATIIHLHARHGTDAKAYTDVWDALEAEGVDCPTYMGTGSGRSAALAARAAGDESTAEAPGYESVEAVGVRARNRMEIAPVIAGSVDWYPLDPREGTHGQPVLLRRTIDDAIYELEVAKRLDMWASHDIWEPGNLRLVCHLFQQGGHYHRPMLLKWFMSDYSGFGMPPRSRYVDTFVSMVPDDVDHEWLVLPYGSEETSCWGVWTHAIASGGHVRVGIGDNPGAPGERFPATNAARVEQMVEVASRMGRPIATVESVRERFRAF